MIYRIMEIRPYKSSDFYEIKTWICDTRTHAFWCADLMPYPLEKQSFENTFKNTDTAFTAVNDNNNPIGFFCLSFNAAVKETKLKFIILAPELRGKGHGKEMLSLAIKYALENGAESVQLNVFENNIKAQKCYLRAGFTERASTQNAFCFNGENWTRCNMSINKTTAKRYLISL